MFRTGQTVYATKDIYRSILDEGKPTKLASKGAPLRVTGSTGVDNTVVVFSEEAGLEFVATLDELVS